MIDVVIIVTSAKGGGYVRWFLCLFVSKITRKSKQMLMKSSENVETLNLKTKLLKMIWVIHAGVQQVAVFNKNQCVEGNNVE